MSDYVVTQDNNDQDLYAMSPTTLLVGYINGRHWDVGQEFVVGDLYLLSYISRTTPQAWAMPFNPYHRPSPKLAGYEWVVTSDSYSDYRIRFTRVPTQASNVPAGINPEAWAAMPAAVQNWLLNK
jgi:hypothetical protein